MHKSSLVSPPGLILIDRAINDVHNEYRSLWNEGARSAGPETHTLTLRDRLNSRWIGNDRTVSSIGAAYGRWASSGLSRARH